MAKRNKLSKFAEMATFPNVFQNFDYLRPELTGPNGDLVELRGQWAEKHFKNEHPITLELACGRGEYALGMGRLYPERNFIGVDIKGARIWKGAGIALNEGLDNVAFLRTRIELLDRFFAPGEIDEIWVTFPDPFLKKGKSNRRLTSDRFLDLYKKMLPPGGTVHLKTDSPVLYEFSLEVLAERTDWKIVAQDDDIYRNETPYAPELRSIKTRYEQLDIAQSNRIHYLKIQSTEAPSESEQTGLSTQTNHNPNTMHQHRQTIEAAWEDRSLLKEAATQEAIRSILEELDKGRLRVAEPTAEGWQVNQWVKKAVVLYFPIQQMETLEVGMYEYHDKIPLKRDFAAQGVRVVPPAVARYGSFLEKGVIMMPSYVNLGAWVGSGTMVDTWATVGSCAQIGRNVHLSGGVGIGGVLEPLQATPTIIEDNCFIGSRCIVVEGVQVEREAVLGANVVLTQSTHIIDVTGDEPKTYKGRVPARSVVIPGTYTKKFMAGEFQVSCALIIGQRKESTDKKTSLNEALRDHSVAV